MWQTIWTKLKAEWKTFVLAVSTTVVGAWQFAVASGANLPDLLAWVPDQYKSAALFGLGAALLLLRKYLPTDTE